MKKTEKSMIKLIIVILIVTIIVLIGIIIKITNTNNTINKQKESKEQQLTQTTSDNSYVGMQEHLLEVNKQEEKLLSFKTAIADYIDETGGIKPEYTADTATFGESIKGIVAEVTKDATVTAEDITEGKTAWVNGNLITGTNDGGNLVKSSDNVTIPQGVKRAYILITQLTSYNTSSCNIEGSIVKSKKEVARSSLIESDVAAAVNTIKEIELTGEEGTISVTFSGGSGSFVKNAYVLLYIQ